MTPAFVLRRRLYLLVVLFLCILVILPAFNVIHSYFMTSGETIQSNHVQELDYSLANLSRAGFSAEDHTKLQRKYLDLEQDIKAIEVKKYRLERYNRYLALEPTRRGVGEQAERAPITPEEQALGDEQLKVHGYYQVVSDKIAVDRAIRDNRTPECLAVQYPHDLPAASIIISFVNEPFSMLVRTVTAVINRTPPHLLHEVLLVDDASDKPEMINIDELEAYIKTTWPDGIVKLIRNPERLGIMRAKMKACQMAKGEILIMMDSHTEVSRGWIEPMAARLKEYPDKLVFPPLNAISTRDFSHAGGNFVYTVNFRLDMLCYVRPFYNVPDLTVPQPSVNFLAGTFAVHRKTFLKFGGYDDGMNGWGGEDTEIGLLYWMCGSGCETLGCSRVYLMHKGAHPYKSNGTHTFRNMQRIAEMWLGDKYKHYFYMRHPFMKKADPGDMTKRLAKIKELGCKNFSWFREHFPEGHKIVVFPDENATHWGQIRSVGHEGWCLDKGNETYNSGITKYRCYGTPPDTPWKQLFSYRTTRQITTSYAALVYRGKTPGGDLLHQAGYSYNPELDTHTWTHDKTRQQLIHDLSGLCLDMDGNINNSTIAEFGKPTLNTCTDSKTQKFVWEKEVKAPQV